MDRAYTCMFTKTFRLPDGTSKYYRKSLELPFPPYVGLSVAGSDFDSGKIADVLWDADSEHFICTTYLEELSTDRNLDLLVAMGGWEESSDEEWTLADERHFVLKTLREQMISLHDDMCDRLKGVQGFNNEPGFEKLLRELKEKNGTHDE